MSDKSHHGKGKHHLQSKKSKAKQRAAALPVPQRDASPQREAAAPPEIKAPPVKVPAAARTARRYPYITAELRGIGILAGIIFFILIVLALVLS